MNIHVNLKAIGKRKASVKTVTCQIKGHPGTLRELILAVAEAGVEEYCGQNLCSGGLVLSR